MGLYQTTSHTEITRYLTFQVKLIFRNIAYGVIKELNKEPRREDYFNATGEIEWGGGHHDIGHFDDESFKEDMILFNYQCMPSGKYHERHVEIPESVELQPGQFIKVKYVYNKWDLYYKLRPDTKLLFHKDRLSKNIVIKEFEERIK